MGENINNASAQKGSKYLTTPNNPNFNTTAANKTEPSVDASTCAFGNHK